MSGAPPADAVDLYRTNPFRVLGLPVDADSRSVRRRRDEFRLAHELGTPVRVIDGRLQLDPPPDEHAVDLAYAAWQNLGRRLTAELFWFWGPPDAEESDRSVSARHDRAVWAHCRALDLERHASLAKVDRESRDETWRTAARAWGGLVGDDAVWEHLQRRVAEIDDPRLTNRHVTELRMSLPDRWLEISSRLALDVVERTSGDVRRHQFTMFEFATSAGVGEVTVRRAMYAGAAPIIGQIETACDDTRKAARARPEVAGRAGTDTAAALERPLLHVNLLLTSSDASAQRVHDQVAATLRQCAVHEFNAVTTGKLLTVAVAPGAVTSATACIELLEKARGLASSTTAALIDTDIRTMRTYIAAAPGTSSPTAPARRPATARPPTSYRPPATRTSVNWPVVAGTVVFSVFFVGAMAAQSYVLFVVGFVVACFAFSVGQR